MKKYRTKIVEIEAIQHNSNNVTDLIEFITGITPELNMFIDTPNFCFANLNISMNDYVVKNKMGRFEVYHPDIFEQTYEECE